MLRRSLPYHAFALARAATLYRTLPLHYSAVPLPIVTLPSYAIAKRRRALQYLCGATRCVAAARLCCAVPVPFIAVQFLRFGGH